MKITYCLLVNPDFETKGITRIEYIKSKFPRDLGDSMRVGDITYRVGAIADARSEIVSFGNDLIKKTNKLNREREYSKIIIK
tara:strand:+ start:1615 stop:1860 length:246 start_codon:yes stop_codon:yes gene_type:complete